MFKFLKITIIFATSLSLISCSSYKPILDQNEKYRAVGEKQAQQDIDSCKKDADDYLDKYKAERAMKEAGRKAVIGGVIGAAAGAIFGGGVRSALVGTAIGAGAGGAIGGLSVVGEDNVEPDVIKQRYITNCLGRKGYSIIGWR